MASNVSMESISRKAADKALLLLGGEKVKSQSVPVVFHPDSGIVILCGLISGINGENIFRNQSFLCGKLNQPVASKDVTIIDDGKMNKGVGSVPFDDEGIPSGKKLIIENGELKTFLYNTYSSCFLVMGCWNNNLKFILYNCDSSLSN